ELSAQEAHAGEGVLWRGSPRSRRVHLGIDEAFGLGTGQYKKKRCQRVSEKECDQPPEMRTIFQVHVRRILQLCANHGLRPLVYTDMLFSLAPPATKPPPPKAVEGATRRLRARPISKKPAATTLKRSPAHLPKQRKKVEEEEEEEEEEEYGGGEEEEEDVDSEEEYEAGGQGQDYEGEEEDGTGDSSRAARAKRRRVNPQLAWINSVLGEHELDVVAWDYSGATPTHYEEMIEKHGHLVSRARRLVLSVGLWTWNRFWAALPWAFDHLDAAVLGAHRSNVTQIYVTLWADDGAEVAPASAMAGLHYFAQLVRSVSVEGVLRGEIKRMAGMSFEALSGQGVSFGDVLEACAIDSAPGAPTGWGTTNLAKWLLWEDPLLAHLSPQ
ncbi:hypothetical protein CYMTET_29671, partial [Cymbomonas tetramitiformis]